VSRNRRRQRRRGFRRRCLCGSGFGHDAAGKAALVGRCGLALAGTPRRLQRLRALDLDLPGRKSEYLTAVAEAALDGELDGAAIRKLDPAEAVRRLTAIKGLGPFAAELAVLRRARALGTQPPADSVGRARLITPIDSATSQPGAQVEAVLAEPTPRGVPAVTAVG